MLQQSLSRMQSLHKGLSEEQQVASLSLSWVAVSGTDTGIYQDLKRPNVLERFQLTERNNGVRGPAMAETGHFSGRPLVPSMSGRLSLQEASNVQEVVPSWSYNRPLHSDQSSEEDQGCVPASQNSSPPLRLSHCSNESFYKGDTKKEPCLFEKWVATRQVSLKDTYEDTGQPPPEQVRKTMLDQDALFREQVQELHRVYKVQTALMSEMKKMDASHTGTPAQVIVNNRSSWTTIQSPSMEKDSSGTGSMHEHDMVTPQVDKEVTLTKMADSDSKRQSSEGGRKLTRRRTLNLELPPEENMDEEEAEDMIEVDELQVRAQWAGSVVKCPQQHEVSAPYPRSDNCGREAPYRPTPTMATQTFLGGLWGLSLERKTEEQNEDWQGRSQIAEKGSFQTEVEKPVHHAAPWLTQGNGLKCAQPRPQPQEMRNQGIWVKEPQKTHPWATTTKGAFRAGPVTPMRPQSQSYGPYSFNEEGLPAFSTPREGEASLSIYGPTGFNQGYPLAASTVPALGMLGPPAEGPLKIPGQGLVVPAMNGGWFSPPFRPQQTVPQAGWQHMATAFHATPGPMCGIPGAPAPILGMNVDGMWRMPEGLSAASWTPANNGPPFSPFSIIPPPKPPFKRPPKLVLRQDGTTTELKILSPKKDPSPSASCDEVGGVLKEEERQGENSAFEHGHNGHVSGVKKSITGHRPRAGVRREREEHESIVGSDCERGGRSGSSSEYCSPSGAANGAAESPAQGSLEHVDDQRNQCDGAQSGEMGVRKVINPGEVAGGLAPAFRLGEFLPSGKEEKGVNLEELTGRPQHDILESIDGKRLCVTENMNLAAEGRRTQYSQGMIGVEQHTQALIPPTTGREPARDTCHQSSHGAFGKLCHKEGTGLGECTLPGVNHSCFPGVPQDHVQDPPPVNESITESHQLVKGPDQENFVDGQDSRSKPSIDTSGLLTINCVSSSSSISLVKQVTDSFAETEELQQTEGNKVTEVTPSKDTSVGESKVEETSSVHM